VTARTVGRLGVLAALVAVLVIVLLPTFRRIMRDITLPLDYRGTIRAQARAQHVPASLIAAVIFAETKFDARTSATGALGLMQIEPATAEFLARRSGATSFHLADLAHPATNIRYGTYYLRYLLERYHGDETLALAAYNGGETNVDRWLSRARAARVRFTLGEIPFPETRAYVQRVEQAQHSYAKDYGL
jgi:peptidoglycan lytic transglycosylase